MFQIRLIPSLEYLLLLLGNITKGFTASAKIHTFKSQNSFDGRENSKLANQSDHIIYYMLIMLRSIAISCLESIVDFMNCRAEYIVCAAYSAIRTCAQA